VLSTVVLPLTQHRGVPTPFCRLGGVARYILWKRNAGHSEFGDTVESVDLDKRYISLQYPLLYSALSLAVMTSEADWLEGCERIQAICGISARCAGS
jgi:hypothetical protein